MRELERENRKLRETGADQLGGIKIKRVLLYPGLIKFDISADKEGRWRPQLLLRR